MKIVKDGLLFPSIVCVNQDVIGYVRKSTIFCNVVKPPNTCLLSVRSDHHLQIRKKFQSAASSHASRPFNKDKIIKVKKNTCKFNKLFLNLI
jgi:hypothetical protein